MKWILRAMTLGVCVALVMPPVNGADTKPEKSKDKTKPEPRPTFWANTRDDLYHLSTCTKATKPSGANGVGASEAELIRLGYYPDPNCLPNRSVAYKAGRLVRVEGIPDLSLRGAAESGNSARDPLEGAKLPSVNPPNPAGGFPSLAPPASPGEPKPAEASPNQTKPAETKPNEPKNPFADPGKAPTPPANPSATGGFPGGNPPQATRPDPAFFVSTVQPVLRACTCHATPGQPANRRFALVRAASGNFTDAESARNYAAVVSKVVFRNPERSLLMLKPTGRVQHGGGALIREGTPEFKALLDWINGAMPR